MRQPFRVSFDSLKIGDHQLATNISARPNALQRTAAARESGAGDVARRAKERTSSAANALSIAEGKVHVHDLHATILQLLGFDHEALTYRYAGRDFRLTDVFGKVINELIA